MSARNSSPANASPHVAVGSFDRRSPPLLLRQRRREGGAGLLLLSSGGCECRKAAMPRRHTAARATAPSPRNRSLAHRSATSAAYPRRLRPPALRPRPAVVVAVALFVDMDAAPSANRARGGRPVISKALAGVGNGAGVLVNGCPRRTSSKKLSEIQLWSASDLET